MDRQDRRAKRPPIEIPIEMLAETMPATPKPVMSKARHPKPPAPVPSKHGLPR